MKHKFLIAVYVLAVAATLIISGCVSETNVSPGVSPEEVGLDFCEVDADCIPLPSACHPRTCINKEFDDQYTEPEMCTMMFDSQAAYSPEDCVCKNSRCVNNNLALPE